ncbi:MAG: NUDIX hydrolase [Caulobacter sp.]|nr:NUDIX hydrolase [Caulobacter sp.]
MSGKAGAKQGEGKRQARRRQVAALPWRALDAAGKVAPPLEILLVSSRETRRWVIPKGWPMKGKANHEAAAQEAYEEAGLQGRIVETPFGEYPYLKRLKSGAGRDVTVDVYPLEVTSQLDVWPEKGQRSLQWMSPIEAALAVQEPELRDLIARFAGVSLPEEERPAPVPAPTPVRVAFQRLRRRVNALWRRARR